MGLKYASDEWYENEPVLVTMETGQTVGVKGNVTLADPKTFIGCVSIAQAAWSDPKTYIGLATVDVGLQKTGAGKTLRINPFGFNTTNLSGATIFINSSQKSYYVTNVILNTNATVGVNFMSGVTYLTGNASLTMTLDPNGGFVENGSPVSPIYFGLAQQQSFSLVMDKAVTITGKIIWYEE